jgi:hypothetical protein
VNLCYFLQNFFLLSYELSFFGLIIFSIYNFFWFFFLISGEGDICDIYLFLLIEFVIFLSISIFLIFSFFIIFDDCLLLLSTNEIFDDLIKLNIFFWFGFEILLFFIFGIVFIFLLLLLILSIDEILLLLFIFLDFSLLLFICPNNLVLYFFISILNKYLLFIKLLLFIFL